MWTKASPPRSTWKTGIARPLNARIVNLFTPDLRGGTQLQPKIGSVLLFNGFSVSICPLWIFVDIRYISTPYALLSPSFLRDNNASQPGHNIIHHAFFCEGHSEAGATAADTAASAAHNAPRVFQFATFATRLRAPKLFSPPLAPCMHVGRSGQPESRLRTVRQRGSDVVVPEHAAENLGLCSTFRKRRFGGR